MKGDSIIVEDHHRKAAAGVVPAILPQIRRSAARFTLSVAGQSGAGKSETALAIAQALEQAGVHSVIFQQDDYFIHPPKTNDAARRADIDWVGTGEVHLDLMDAHLKAAKDGKPQITKPLVYFEEDRIGEETLAIAGIDVLIAEGTYTTALEEADFHAFIDATSHHTPAHRKERARDETEGAFIEQVLEIEHRIISAHKSRAHLVLPPNTGV